MPKVDISEILKSKAPRIARYTPKFVVNWLRRTVHERDINQIIESYWHLPPQEFIRACFKTWGISYSIEGLEKLDTSKRYLLASNHPFGGMDGMMLADKLIDRFGDVRVVVNDLLMNVEPLRPIWIPVNKHGAQSSEYALLFDSAFMGDCQILTFPAGLCSRMIDGKVQDLEWKTSFIKKAYASQREIVPIFVDGRLSQFFYNLGRLRQAIGIKFNIEMLYLPDEMFSQQGKHFKIYVGEPITLDELGTYGSIREQVEYVRTKTYFLQKNAVYGTKNR